MRRLLVRIIGLLLIAACAPAVQPSDQFLAASRDFSQRLRWQDWHGAARYMEAPHGEEFLERFRPLEGLHITDVQLESAELQGEDGRVAAWMVMEYYLLPSLTVKKLRFRQEWVYRDPGRSGQWRIASPFPDFP